MQNNKALPTTLAEIRNCAASMFQDKAVVSVVVQASWGLCTVYRDGSVFAA